MQNKPKKYLKDEDLFIDMKQKLEGLAPIYID